MSAPTNQPGAAFWWRLPDDETALMSLGLAELKCYLVVARAIQRDRNGGKAEPPSDRAAHWLEQSRERSCGNGGFGQTQDADL